ncbi:MAG: alanine racemase [Clostridiales bacterium]|nr:alanine racemase [Clostridiales bacterium]
MYKETMRAAWAEINLSNLDFNIKQIKEKVGMDKKITGIIKADGYGHGSVKCASVLKSNGVSSFGVATLSEAIKLRKAGYTTEQILILGLTPEPFADVLAEYDLTPVVCSYTNAEAINNAARKAGKTLECYIAVDTGMGRIGYNPEDPSSVEDVKMITTLQNLKLVGLFSHFATADAADKNYAHMQENRYAGFYKALMKEDIVLPMRALANSAAIMEIPTAHYNQVRPGIILYGLYPSDEVDRSKFEIRPVMSVKASIVHLKKVPAGTSISYGRKWTAQKDSIIATIPLGYADGYPRPYSSKAEVIVNGVKAPITGNICMDQCMIDVTNVPYVRIGDEVTVMGKDGIYEISADDIANATGTINYEIACAFGQRLPKVYVY